QRSGPSDTASQPTTAGRTSVSASPPRRVSGSAPTPTTSSQPLYAPARTPLPELASARWASALHPQASGSAARVATTDERSSSADNHEPSATTHTPPHTEPAAQK